jgi:hypothetical protein
VRAIDRTTDLFVASVKEAIPGVKLNVQKSTNGHGRSNYVYIHSGWPQIKVRISDHPVGMRRAMRGTEDLFVHHLAKPWLGELRKRLNQQDMKL